MAESTNEDPAQKPPGDRLTGWKDIAGHLRRGVRTAQRWERDFGLPVRRIGPERSESVFAFTAEIDTWLLSSSAAGATGQTSRESSADLNGSPVEPGAQPEPGAPSGSRSEDQSPGVPVEYSAVPERGPRHLHAWIGLLAAAVIVLGAIGAWRELAGRQTSTSVTPGPPTSWRIDGDSLIALDARGGTVWTYAFGVPMGMDTYGIALGTLENQAGIDDLDGDGHREVWFLGRAARSADESVRAAYLFNEDGTVRWSYRYSGNVRFGDTTYGPPWLAHRIFVTASVDDRTPRSIWVASTERSQFPSVLQRLDVLTGRPLTTYWSNGHISSLLLHTLKGRRVVLVGASDNDAVASSLAVLDASSPNGAAPSVRDKYRCMDGPPGHPLAFVVFPKPRRFASIDESGTAWAIDSRTPGSLAVSVAHAQSGPIFATGIYRLDDDLRPIGVDTADKYQLVYDSLVREWALPPFAPVEVDPGREFLPILHWIGGKLVPVGAR